jgi:hypothetical protein
MNSEITVKSLIAVDELGIVERLIEQMRPSTNDTVLLKRLNLASDMVKQAAGYLGFVASRSRVQSEQEERRKDEIIRQYKASIEARRCDEVSHDA